MKIKSKRSLRMHEFSVIDDDCYIDARSTKGVHLMEASRLGKRGILTTTSKLSLVGVGFRLGARSGVGDYFHIGCSGGVDIGSDVIIGPYLTIHSQEHLYADRDIPIRQQGTRQQEVTIANDCWLGARVTLLAGTSLGPRTIVAAGAVVSGTHAGNEILGGIPAKKIRSI
ncbi:acyltransferase [Williamsia herbipolensis]|uniref:acyltransferase n=1 Tax=Williamsia herbipolensis TaxID=1603258 RepID=UPI001364BB5D|nr:acyltransferase [Williamsia herbipolensis]